MKKHVFLSNNFAYYIILSRICQGFLCFFRKKRQKYAKGAKVSYQSMTFAGMGNFFGKRI